MTTAESNHSTHARFRGWHELIVAVLLVVLLIVAGWLMPSFLQLRSQLLLSRHLWDFGLLALGMTLVVITGGIDLSVGSTMGLCAVVFGQTFSATGNSGAASLACLATGIVCGAWNGTLISRAKVHPLIVTLASYAAFRGIAEGLSQGASYSRFGEMLASVSRTTWLGLPLPGWLFFVLAAGLSIFLMAMPSGRFLYAIGHNERAARFAGITVDRLKFWLYTFNGLVAGLATIIYISRFDTAKADAGKGFELNAITAVVVGGTSIFGGRGTIVGTVFGLLLIHETRQFVSRYWQSDEWTSIVVGSLLIVSVLISRVVSRSNS